jgi:Na+/H+ antiporter NhaC
MAFGVWSLVPPLVVVTVALKTRRAFEPLVVGCVAGFLIIDWRAFPGNFLDSLLKTFQDESLVWVIVVCTLYGSIIQLMVNSGGIRAFGDWLLQWLTTSKRAMVGSWLVGIGIFMDDYLSALVVGNTMKRVTDRLRMPREMLAFMVNSTAAAVCVIIPATTWSLYVGKLYEDASFVPKGRGFSAYVHTIPFTFYGLAVVAIAGLVAAGVIPVVGRMRRAMERVDQGGPLAPPGSENFTSLVPLPETGTGKPRYFVVPLVLVLGITVATGIDALKGVALALALTAAYYVVAKVMTYEAVFEAVWAGARGMVFTLAVLVMSYVLKAVGDQMGLTQYLVDAMRAHAGREALPALIFMALGLVSFATGSSWGVYAVAVPIVVALIGSLGIHPWLSMGAVVSAGALGSHACFYSDASVLSATSAECNNVEHGLTQLPYAGLAFGLSAVGYLIAGYLL